MGKKLEPFFDTDTVCCSLERVCWLVYSSAGFLGHLVSRVFAR